MEDQEGRLIRADFERFIILVVYAPFSGTYGKIEEAKRLEAEKYQWEFRIKMW
jgi:exonuclease III